MCGRVEPAAPDAPVSKRSSRIRKSTRAWGTGGTGGSLAQRLGMDLHCAIILCLLCTDGSIDLGRGSLLNPNDGEGTSTIGRLSARCRWKVIRSFIMPIVRIGCREFKCIGDRPPQDHPHIYLNMGDASEILCPYCSTLFCFDPSLGVHEADPADCAYGDID